MSNKVSWSEPAEVEEDQALRKTVKTSSSVVQEDMEHRALIGLIKQYEEQGFQVDVKLTFKEPKK